MVRPGRCSARVRSTVLTVVPGRVLPQPVSTGATVAGGAAISRLVGGREARRRRQRVAYRSVAMDCRAPRRRGVPVVGGFTNELPLHRQNDQLRLSAPGRTTWCTGPLCGRWRKPSSVPQAAGCRNGLRPRRPSPAGPGTSAGRSAEIRAQRDRLSTRSQGRTALVADRPAFWKLDTLREARLLHARRCAGHQTRTRIRRHGAVDGLRRARAGTAIER